ncbi:CRTAC1 family protein [Agaribacter flavus]|uniref:CRTAC1 family protein n=1 Tax=Agaribacter flavus TaxID=1902781 RepID=A0ABV7FMV7_9ALTE
MAHFSCSYFYKSLCMFSVLLLCTACQPSSPPSFVLTQGKETSYQAKVTGSVNKKLIIKGNNPQNYAAISVYNNGQLLVDKLGIASTGEFSTSVLLRFSDLGEYTLELRSHNADLVIDSLELVDADTVSIPYFKDISEQAGLDKVSSIKYGGPSIADIDNDGDYDFIVNNHNAESSKIYWNNGDGTVKKHYKNLARWFMHDLHGTALADYDKDGDLDLVLTQGGGNGKFPSTANFYKNDNSNFIRYTGDVGIHKGGRGRGARWLDMDMDGDLDLLLFNETGLAREKPQHFFYENDGQGKLTLTDVDGIQDVHPSRVLITDLNQDQIADIVLYGPLSVWQGNGDFTFTDITEQFPSAVSGITAVNAMADIDIDNDGDLDLYLATGKPFEGGKGESPSFDFDPFNKLLAIKPRGFKGVDRFEFEAEGNIRFFNYNYVSQGVFRGKDYPIFLGKDKHAFVLKTGEESTLIAEQAEGWPDKRDENGVYFGYLGNGKWRAELVRKDNIFWSFQFSLSGVKAAHTDFIPENRFNRDVLLRNDNGQFVDVTDEWGLPSGSNSLGVTVGDFNNDSFQDVFVYRWGDITHRISDYMLLNNGKGQFETMTMHGANDVGGPGNGDMGQAFDFDLDGKVDLLNSAERGEWYLYSNSLESNGHYFKIRVGNSPEAGIDPYGAVVTLKTKGKSLSKRVGSAGEVFSQSLLNIVHFGLGESEKIESVEVKWRNGESQSYQDLDVNQLIATQPVTEGRQQDFDPDTVQLAQSPFIKITNKTELESGKLKVGDEFQVLVDYHAGSGQKVIWADEGGVRFWLRHFRSKWFPVKDVVLLDEKPLYTELGKSQMTFSTEGMLATKDLPPGHFYMLSVSFTASDGNTYNDSIYPLQLVE